MAMRATEIAEITEIDLEHFQFAPGNGREVGFKEKRPGIEHVLALSGQISGLYGNTRNLPAQPAGNLPDLV